MNIAPFYAMVQIPWAQSFLTRKSFFEKNCQHGEIFTCTSRFSNQFHLGLSWRVHMVKILQRHIRCYSFKLFSPWKGWQWQTTFVKPSQWSISTVRLTKNLFRLEAMASHQRIASTQRVQSLLDPCSPHVRARKLLQNQSAGKLWRPTWLPSNIAATLFFRTKCSYREIGWFIAHCVDGVRNNCPTITWSLVIASSKLWHLMQKSAEKKQFGKNDD